MNKTLAIAIPAVLVLSLAGWVYARHNEAENAREKALQAKQPAPITVEIATVAPATISNRITALGSMESPYTVRLSPNVAGFITYLQAREGDSVQAGQVLARIDPAEVEGEILAAQASLAQAQHSYDQANLTQNANAVGINSTVNQDKAAVSSALADYHEAEVTFEATVSAAHAATVDAQSKVRSASAQVQTGIANLQLAQANFEDAHAKYAREYSLYTQGLVAPQDVDDAQAALRVDQATVNANEKTVQTNRGALVSAEEEEREAENQETITTKKGMSTISDMKSTLTQAQSTLKTAAANRSQIPAYVQNLKALYSSVVAAKAALTQAIARRAYLVVKSSVDGTVTERLADPGAEASPGSPILILQYLKWLFVTAYVPVQYADTIQAGLDVEISLDAFPNRIFHGVISALNKSADPSNHQYMVRVKVDNSEKLFRPGMYATINFVGSVVHAKIAAPLKAVTFATDGTATVTTIDDKNLAHIVSITYGVSDKNNVEIKSGVANGDKLVTKSQTEVYEDSPVKVGKVVMKSKKGDSGAGKNPPTGGSSVDSSPMTGSAVTSPGSPSGTSVRGGAGTAGPNETAPGGIAARGGAMGTTGASAGGK
jgi:RND family efflux transporter MFP subunit